MQTSSCNLGTVRSTAG